MRSRSPTTAAASRSRSARSTRRCRTDGYEPLGSVLETNCDDWPFLVDSVSAALEARGEQVVRLVHPIIGISREDGKITRGQPRAQRGPPRVGHALRPRAPAHRARAGRSCEADVEAVLLAVRSTVTDFGAMTQRVESMISLARRAQRALRHRRGARGGGLPRLAAARQLRAARRARVRDPRRRVPLHPGLGARHPGRRGALGVRDAGAARRSCPEALRQLATERRAADRRQGQRALAGAPPRADGLRRRAPRARRTASSPARRACSACSRPRPTPSRRPRRRCCTASCAACSRPRT